MRGRPSHQEHFSSSNGLEPILLFRNSFRILGWFRLGDNDEDNPWWVARGRSLVKTMSASPSSLQLANAGGRVHVSAYASWSSKKRRCRGSHRVTWAVPHTLAVCCRALGASVEPEPLLSSYSQSSTCDQLQIKDGTSGPSP